MFGTRLLIDSQPPLQDRKREQWSQKEPVPPGASKFARRVARATGQDGRMGFLERTGNDPGIVNLPKLPFAREALFGPGTQQDLQRLFVAGLCFGDGNAKSVVQPGMPSTH